MLVIMMWLIVRLLCGIFLFETIDVVNLQVHGLPM